MPEGSGRPTAVSRRRELNPYEVLQISPSASLEVIKAAYRVLARGTHPDVNTHADSTSRMREINLAFQILSDPHRRAEYDAVTRPVRLQLARRAQVERRQAYAGPRSEMVRDRIVSMPAGRPSAFARVRGPLVVALAMLAFLILVVVVAAWAINDLTDERFESGLLGAGRFSAQNTADRLIPVELFSSSDASSGQP
jgi:curved DNA-binding protein CbpA